MIQVKCPQCNTSLALKQAPASGKVKCPKCAAVVSVTASPKAPAAAPTARPAAPTARPAASAPRPAAAAARQASTAGNTSKGFTDDIDFRSIPVPAAPAPSGFFPVLGEARVYDGPVALDPIPKQKSADDDDDEDDSHGSEAASPRAKRGGKANQSKLIGIIAGVVLLVAVAGGGAYMFLGGGGGGGAPAVDVAAQAASATPPGYQTKSLHNCVVYMPAGSTGDVKIPGAIEAEIVTSDATGSIFLLAAMDGGSLPIENPQMKKKTNNSLGGEMLGGNETERNGYKGIKGIQDQSPFLPRMSVEAFHHDGRFVIIGHATNSEMKSASGETVIGGSSADEAKEVETFYSSFKIGPAPAGGLFGN